MSISCERPETYSALPGHACIPASLWVYDSCSPSESVNSSASNGPRHNSALTVCLLMWSHFNLNNETPKAWWSVPQACILNASGLCGAHVEHQWNLEICTCIHFPALSTTALMLDRKVRFKLGRNRATNVSEFPVEARMASSNVSKVN
jgi:hypothetical protein